MNNNHSPPVFEAFFGPSSYKPPEYYPNTPKFVNITEGPPPTCDYYIPRKFRNIRSPPPTFKQHPALERRVRIREKLFEQLQDDPIYEVYAKEKQRQAESIKAKQRINRIKSSFIQQPNPPSPSMVWNDSRYWNQLRNTDESLDKTEITPFDADLSPTRRLNTSKHRRPKRKMSEQK